MQSFQLHEHATSVPIDSYQLEDWQKGYESLREEFDYWIDQVEGEIPPDLEGTLFRNGPGLLDVGGQHVQHPFDGDGMISAIAFSQGKAHFRNRFIQTEGFIAEQKAKKMLYRGVFGTQKPGGWLANAFDFRLKNVANTQVIYWGGKLLALWEAAEPHRLDPDTLETIGIDYLNGVLKPGSAFAAHPWIDPSCAEDDGAPCLVNFSIKPGLSTTITIFELDQQCKVIRQHAHAVPGFAFIHDFAITPNYCIFFQNPVHFNPLPFVLGLKGAGECIQFQGDRPTQIIVIPRHGSAPVQRLSVQSGFVFHHANAFEQDECLYVDSVCYESLPSVEPDTDYRQVKFEKIAPGQLWRFQLNLKANTVERKLIESRCCEFPFVHPNHAGRPYRYVYLGAAHTAQGNAPLQAILKVDLVAGDRQIWSAAPHGYVGEPIFVPRSTAASKVGQYPTYQTGMHPKAEPFQANGESSNDEDFGWLLTLVYNSEQERSELVILDAKDLTKEPVARLHLKHHIPYGLHGSFTQTCFVPKPHP